MCRLFAQIATAPARARDLLVESEFSLLKQGNFDKSNPQKDGWGLAHFGPAGRAVVAKSPRPIYRESAAFRRAADAALSPVVIAHIRAASNPSGLPKASLINAANTQPFTDGRWVFAHNGTLQIPREVAARLGPLRRKLRSSNDSEVYFWHFRKHLDRAGSVPEAVRRCVAEIWQIWESGARAGNPDKPSPYTSLNFVASDGRALYAFCHAARRGLADHGVCNPDQPWSVMSFSRRGARLVVASENLDRTGWTRMRPPELLCAEPARRGLRVKRVRLKGLPQLEFGGCAAARE